VLRDPEQFREHARARVRQNKTIVAGHIASNPRLDRGKSVAGVVELPWIVDADEKACREVYRHLAEDLDALMLPASGFELPDTFFRVGFGGDQDTFKLGLERFDTARKILNSDEHKRATAR
jgi:hypothetical protein